MIKYVLNDQIVDQDKALVHVSDLALLRGYGVFDFFRMVGLKPLYIDDHLIRFFSSAEALRLKCPLSLQELKSIILRLIDINQIENSGIRIVLTGGASESGYSIGAPTLFIRNEPITPLPEAHFKHGIKLISHEYQRDLPEVKSINYLTAIYKLPDIQHQGASDVLYHSGGKISEVSRSNFFIVDDQERIVTAGKGILKGINRKHVMHMAKDHYDVVEEDIFLPNLSKASEAFITGTTKKVMPVCQVDNINIGDGKPGKITRELQRKYDLYIDEFIR